MPTDNSHLEAKALLRLKHLPGGPVTVLDLFAGEGKVWARVEQLAGRRIERDTADQRKETGPTFAGDNLKYLPEMDLAPYNVIDCDAYGVPYAQAKALFGNKTLAPGTVVFYTLCRSYARLVPVALLAEISVTKAMHRAAPTLVCTTLGMAAWYGFLAKNGIDRVYVMRFGYETHATMVKEYGCFRTPLVKT